MKPLSFDFISDILFDKKKNAARQWGFRFLLILPFTIPVLIIGFFHYQSLYLHNTDRVYARQTSLASLSARVLYEKFDMLTDIGYSLASRPGISQLMAEGRWQEAIDLLRDVPDNFDYIERLFISDAKGVEQADTPHYPGVVGVDFSHRDWYKGAVSTGRPYVSEVYKRRAEPAYNVVAVSIPVFTPSNEIIGILVLQVRLETLLEWMNSIHFSPGELAFAIDHNAQIAAHINIRPQEEIVNYGGFTPAVRALKGETGISFAWDFLTNKEVLAAYSPVKDYGWGVVVQGPPHLLFETRDLQSRTLIMFYGVMTLSGLLFGIFLLRIFEVIGGFRQREHTFLESIGDAVIVVDRNLCVTLWNPAAEQISGWRSEEVLGKKLTDIIQIVREADGEPAHDFIFNALTSGTRQSPPELINMVGKDNRVLPIGDSAAPVFDASGNVTGCILVIRDATSERSAWHELEVKHDELASVIDEKIRELASSETRYRELFMGAPDPIVILDTMGIILSINPAIEQVIGYAPEELTGKHFVKTGVIAEGSVETTLKQFSLTLMGDPQPPFEIEVLDKNGCLHDFEAHARFMTGGEKACIQVILRDISDRKRAQNQLEESQRRLSVLMSNLDGIVYRCRHDPFWTMEFVSTGCFELTGYKPEDLVWNRKVSYAEIIHPDDLKMVRQEIGRAVFKQQTFQLRYRIKTQQGVEKWVWEKGRAVSGTGEEGVCLEGFITDITKQKDIENKFLQAQKMEPVGRLASGVAHDFNNILTIIQGYAEMMLRHMTPENENYIFLKEIFEASLRASSLTRQLLAFSRRSVINRKVINVNVLISDLEKLLRRLIGEDVLLTVHLAPDLRPVRMDPSQLEQVIINLAVNARDAMPDGGEIIIETRNADKASSRKDAKGDRQDFIELTVTDTGKGMSEEIKEHIFEPFFTTKEEGKGTGLGLATCAGILNDAGGSIQVQSVPEQGAVFKILLPALQEAVVPLVSEKKVVDLPRGTETLLVVEDETQLRNFMTMVLRQQGYRVLEAATGSEALEVFESDAEIDLVITDMVMPQLGGRELAEHISDRNPEMKILFMSGYTNNAILQKILSETNATFLQKPFSATAIICRVREMLDGVV